MTCGETFDVHFVNGGQVPWGMQPPVPAPVEERITDDGARHEWRTVVIVPRIFRLAHDVRKHRRMPLRLPLYRFCIRVEQELCGIAPRTLLGGIGSVHTKSI